MVLLFIVTGPPDSTKVQIASEPTKRRNDAAASSLETPPARFDSSARATRCTPAWQPRARARRAPRRRSPVTHDFGEEPFVGPPPKRTADEPPTPATLHPPPARSCSSGSTAPRSSSELPAAQSGNVIAEVVGREAPEEVVVIGAHLDSWDLGTGAIDDGAGVGITMAALELIKDAGLAPRRTVRLVLWGAEEVGLIGANAYRDRHEAELAQHVIGSESDFGGGRVWKVTADSQTEEGDALFGEIARLLAPIGVAPGSDDQPGGGPDLYPLIAAGVPTLRLHQDGRDYFDLHHTADDTVDKLDAASLDQNVAAFAVFAWLVADSDVSFRSSTE